MTRVNNKKAVNKHTFHLQEKNVGQEILKSIKSKHCFDSVSLSNQSQFPAITNI